MNLVLLLRDMLTVFRLPAVGDIITFSETSTLDHLGMWPL